MPNHFGVRPKKRPDGTLDVGFPMGDHKLPGIASAEVGACASGIFTAGSEYIGKAIGIASDNVTGNEMAVIFMRAVGQRLPRWV